MKKIYFIVILSFLSYSITYACSLPISGAKYDSLITVKKLNKNNYYYISFPRSVNSSKKIKPPFFITYVSHAIKENCVPDQDLGNGMFSYCPPIDTYSEELKLKKSFFSSQKTTINGKFKFLPKAGYTISIDIIWPGMCETIGSVILSDLKTPNKASNKDATNVAPIL